MIYGPDASAAVHTWLRLVGAAKKHPAGGVVAAADASLALGAALGLVVGDAERLGLARQRVGINFAFALRRVAGPRLDVLLALGGVAPGNLSAKAGGGNEGGGGCDDK